MLAGAEANLASVTVAEHVLLHWQVVRVQGPCRRLGERKARRDHNDRDDLEMA